MGQAVAAVLHPAIEPLQGVLHALEGCRGIPRPEVMEQIRNYTRSALDLIRNPERDPFIRRMHVAFLCLKESTEVEQRLDERGLPITRVTVTDADLYEWAIAQVHLLANGVVPGGNGH
jgi:hypothetical protein